MNREYSFPLWDIILWEIKSNLPANFFFQFISKIAYAYFT